MPKEPMTPSRKLLTLAIATRDDEVLLGMKKRGFGAGRWNGFGGKVEKGESLVEAATRETKEEAGIEIVRLSERGVMDFEFAKESGVILEVHIFHIDTYNGEPHETEEMKPMWFKVSEVPFDSMWPDDKYWFPLFLARKKFKGYFLFGENDSILKHTLEEIS